MMSSEQAAVGSGEQPRMHFGSKLWRPRTAAGGGRMP